MGSKSIYATPRAVTNIKECYFYHTMDVPGYGCIEGEWDLRKAAREYLGSVDFKGKRVLEIGTASGFLCFYMERQGAKVVAYDLSENESWDIVPFSRFDYGQTVLDVKDHIKRLNNSYWLCHKAYNSSARVVYGSVYDIPEEIGMFDISVFTAVLPHLRDPFFALQNALRLTREKVIITDVLWRRYFFLQTLVTILSKFGLRAPLMAFFPNFRTSKRSDTWWMLTPEVIRQFIGVLGFEESEIKYHFKARRHGRRRPLYTIVGHKARNTSSTRESNRITSHCGIAP